MSGTPIFKILRDGRYGRFNPAANTYEIVPREHVPPLRVLQLSEAAAPPAGTDEKRQQHLNMLLAMIEFQKHANDAGDPTASQPYLDELASRFKALRMSWRADQTSTGHIKAVGEGEHEGRTLYGRDAEAALRNQEAAGSPQFEGEPDPERQPSLFENAKLRTEDILSNVLNGRHTSDELQEFGSHLPLLQGSNLDKATEAVRGMGGKPAEAAKIMDEVRAKLDAADKVKGTEPVEPMAKGPLKPLAKLPHHLDALANDAGRPAAIKARGGHQHRLDAIRDALQGKHGPEIKKAVERGAGPDKNRVDKRPGVARHAKIAEELAKLKGPPAAEAEGPPEQMKGLTPEGRAIETAAHEYVRANYEKVRDQYLANPENAEPDPAGGYKSITINTDEWRGLLPGYHGTNAQDVHEPASWINKKLYNDALRTQAGKGNDTLMVLAGGGGSGKGTVFKQFYRKEEYPLVLDQVSDHLGKLEDKLDQAARNGFKPEFVFVDRPPEAAWGGVVGRALDMHKKGRADLKARTVPLHIAVKANVNARRTALELFKKRTDVEAAVIDNTTGVDGERRLITDRKEAINFLQAELDKAEHGLKHGLIDKLRGEVIEGHKSGKIPTHIAKGFLGDDEYFKAETPPPGRTDDGRVSGPEAVPADNAKRPEPAPAKDDRRPQSGRTGSDARSGPPDERPANGAAGGTAGEAKAAGRGVDRYLSQAMGNLKKTSRTAGGVVDTSASKGKADQMAEGLTGADAAQHAINNFEGAVRTVHDAATGGPQTPESVGKLADDLNRQINKGIVKEGVLRRNDDSTKFPYTKVEDLPFAYKQFTKEFAKRLNDPNADPVETAAWVEWRANMADHFWADGVGKTAKALAMIPLMKAGLPLPNYPSNKEFFKFSQPAPYDPTDGPGAYLDEHWEKFRDFYKGLMPKEPTAPRFHEMTRDEWVKGAAERFGPKGEKIGHDTHEGQDWHQQHDEAVDNASMADVRSDPKGWAHRAAVKAAIKAGKPVPPAVLDEYPDLEAEVNKPAAAPAPASPPPPVVPKEPEHPAMERFGKLVADKPAADAAYNALPEAAGGKVINADTARELSPEYAGSKANRVRFSGATVKHAGGYAYERLQRELRNRGERKKLLITAGGPAAGKSSTLSPDAVDKADLVWDTTMQDAKKSTEVLDTALKNGWKVDVNYTHAHPEDWAKGLVARTERTGRWGKFEDAHGQHQRAQENVLAAAKKYAGHPDVNIATFHNPHGGTPEKIGLEDISPGGRYHVAAGDAARAMAAFEKIAATGEAHGKVSPETIGLLRGNKSAEEVARAMEQAETAPAAPAASQGPGMAPGIRHTMGEPTRIDAAGFDKPIPAHFAVVDLAHLKPSHSYASGAPSARGDYPAHLQPRDYAAGSAEDMKVRDMAQRMQVRYHLADVPDASNGSPTVTPDGTVLNGNARTMSLELASRTPGQFEKYREALEKKAAGFGVDPKQLAGMTHPVLVRVVNMDPHGEEAKKFASAGNVAATQSQSPIRTAASLSRVIDSDLLDSLRLNDDTTFSEAVSHPTAGRAFRQHLRELLPPQEQERYFTPDGHLTEGGTELVRSMLLSKVLPVPLVERLGETHKQLKRTIEGSIPQLLKVRRDHPHADLSPQLAEALQFRADNPTATTPGSVDNVLSQGSLFGGQAATLSPAGRMMIDFLNENGDKPRVSRQKLAQFVTDLSAKGGLYGESMPEVPTLAAEALGVEERPGAVFGAVKGEPVPAAAQPGEPPPAASQPAAAAEPAEPAEPPVEMKAQGKAPHEMTKAEFDKKGFWQHANLRDNTDLTGKTFAAGIGPNIVPATNGQPTSVLDRAYGTKAGRHTVIVPKHAIQKGGNGDRIKDGYTVEHSVVPSRDYQPLHEAAVEHALNNGLHVPPEVLKDYPHLTDTAAAQEYWWDRELTGAGRSDIMKPNGVDLPAGVKWRHMSPEDRAKVDHMRPAAFRPENRKKPGEPPAPDDEARHAELLDKGRTDGWTDGEMAEFDQISERRAAKFKDKPHLALAEALHDKLAAGETIDAKALWAAADKAHGGTRAEGKYGPSDAYDALETGFNKSLMGKTDPRVPLDAAKRQAEEIAQKIGTLPTQTNRSGNKDSFQQFSTPPHYSYAAAWLANLRPGDVCLEPSAGTGCLAVQAANGGADVITNELDPKRADFLRHLFGNNKVHVENAEQIAGILPKRGVNPSVVIMNPPFSQTAGRMGDKKELLTGANHIAEAFRMLPEGGRLVAIVGRGMTPESKTYSEWFDKMKEQGTVAANVGVNGREYKKYGTQFDTRMLVFDKTGPHQGETVTGDVDSIPELMDKLEGVRNARPEPAQPASGESLRGPMSGQAEGGGQPGRTAPAATGDRVDGAAGGSQPELGGHPPVLAGDAGVAPAGSGVAAGAGPGGASGGTGGAPGPGGRDPLGATGQPAHGDEGAARHRGNRQPRGKQPLQRPASGVSQLRPPQRVTVQSVDPAAASGTPAPPSKDPAKPAASQEDLGASLYENYKPALLRIPGALPHPTSLVESAAMAAVRPPVPRYQPTLSPDVIEKGMLTAPALESIVYAGQAHQEFLEPDPEEEKHEWSTNGEQTVTKVGGVPRRRGYFIGDGTGTGKGRQISGIIADNFNQGRKKHVWVSKTAKLHADAQRDWRDIGMDPAQVHKFEKIRGNPAPPDEGICFLTYDTLKSRPKDPTLPSNVDELVKWLGPDFDGVIAFDEAHQMSNALSTKGERGDKDASQRALAGIELQKRLPNARVTYVSATGATEVANLAYAERLGMWGEGTPFASKREFVSQMQQGGIAAMEAVAQSLKATGSYGARSLSFDDGTEKGRVTYDRLSHTLSPEQHEMYNTLATGWQSVLENIDKALEASGGSDSPKAKAAAKSQFWGAQQRFFNQLMTSMQTPSVIAGMEKDIAEGRAPVVQLVNTMEAAMNRGLARREEGEDVDSVDVSPREILLQYLEKSFPVHRYEKFTDADGNEGSRLVKDSEGNPVEDPAAVAMREELLNNCGTFKIPESPIDMIINHFGHENVSECTGRTQRIVRKVQADGTSKMELERRPGMANQAEGDAFQGGKKKALIFSDAGGTGSSYHADKNAKNQQQRVHYVLQPGWRADNCVQGFGRTHRTNQAIAPIYKLVQIDQLKAQKRFVSTIARRLDQLGALTRGQRQTGGGGLMSAADNLESPEAAVALERFFRDLEHGQIEGLNHRDVMKQMGLLKEEKEGEPAKKREEKKIPMGQFLNRLLSLRIDLQGAVFDEFDKRHQQVVEQAIRDGSLDTGVENYPADEITRTKEQPVFQDPRTGAEAKLVSTIAKAKNHDKTTFQNVEARKAYGSGPVAYVRGRTSGKVWALIPWTDKTDAKTGTVTKQYKLQGPGGVRFQTFDKVAGALPADVLKHRHGIERNYFSSNYEPLDAQEAKKIWEEQYAEAPDQTETEQHFVTGAILPIWDKFPTAGKPKIYRIRTSDGQTMVGRHVPKDYLPAFRQSLGIAADAKSYSTAEAHTKLSGGRSVAVLSNGWRLKPVRVQGERRIELTGKDMSPSVADALTRAGAIKERINYETRFFVPVGGDGADVLDRILKSRNATITDVTDVPK